MNCREILDSSFCLIGSAIILPTPDAGIRIVAALFGSCVSEGVCIARRGTDALAIDIIIGGRTVPVAVGVAA